MNRLGLLALAFFAIHATATVKRGHPEDLLWACTLANALIAVGLLGGWPVPNAIGTFWLLTGLPIWAMDVATGGELIPTSLLTHAGGLATGIVGMRTIGVPPRAWLWALGGMVGLIALSRAVTPAAANVNVSHAVWRGWEKIFSSHPIYVTFLVVAHAAAFFALEQLLRGVMRS